MGLCSSPRIPDPADAYVSGQRASLQTFPLQHNIEAAARLGQPITVRMPDGSSQTFDFTGLGEGDYQGQYANQMAQSLLELQQQLGPEYVQQRLRELNAADPEGQATRDQLFQSIIADLDQASGAQRPAAEELQKHILDELNKGGTLPDAVARNVSQGVLGGQVARGNFLGNAAAAEEGAALTGASDAIKAQRENAALAFLTSGATPEDVDYRRSEQALHNLGAFASGQSPTAEFGQLSGAGGGVVPFETGGPLPGTDPNAGTRGIQFSNSLYGNQNALYQSSVNPWIAGFSGAANGLNLATSFRGGTGGAGGPTPTNVQPGGWNFVD